jgi:hypothetical protein
MPGIQAGAAENRTRRDLGVERIRALRRANGSRPIALCGIVDPFATVTPMIGYFEG